MKLMEQYKISLDDVKFIEQSAYPRYMLQMDDCDDWDDVADYAECATRKLRVFGVANHWYVVCAKKFGCWEFIDIAKIPRTSAPPWGEILTWMRKTSRVWKADLRSSTTLKLFERSNIFEIISRSTWMWGDETMVKIKFKFHKSCFH
jgi:hypothetical protein